MDLAEARQHIDRERQVIYLDGPGDVDWIFRNDIERRREEAMHVDSVAIRDHFHDEHAWRCPNPRLLRMYIPGLQPNVLRVADALHHTGLTTPGATRIVAEVWRNTTPNALTRQQVRDVNIQTLTRLEREGVLHRASQDTTPRSQTNGAPRSTSSTSGR